VERGHNFERAAQLHDRHCAGAASITTTHVSNTVYLPDLLASTVRHRMQTTGSMSSTLEEKRRLASVSLEYNTKNVMYVVGLPVAEVQPSIMDGNIDEQLCPHAGSENSFQSAVKSSKDASSNNNSNDRMNRQR